jgi:hypothetical protein
MLKKLFQKLFGAYEPEKTVTVQPVQPVQNTITVSATEQPTSTVTVVVEPVAPAPVVAPVEPAIPVAGKKRGRGRPRKDTWEFAEKKQAQKKPAPAKQQKPAPAKRKPRNSA